MVKVATRVRLDCQIFLASASEPNSMGYDATFGIRRGIAPNTCTLFLDPMSPQDLYRALLASNNVASIERALQQFEDSQGEAAQWTPLGGRENNQGTVGASSDSGRSLVERLTNGVDAVMEDEYERHLGRPACRSPREAAAAW